MNANVDVVFDAAMALRESDRLVLASRLLDTVPPSLDELEMGDPGLIDELDRRFNDREGAVEWSDLRICAGGAGQPASLPRPAV